MIHYESNTAAFSEVTIITIYAAYSASHLLPCLLAHRVRHRVCVTSIVGGNTFKEGDHGFAESCGLNFSLLFAPARHLTSSKRYGVLLFIVTSIKHFIMDGSHSQQCHSKKSTSTLSYLPPVGFEDHFTAHAPALPQVTSTRSRNKDSGFAMHRHDHFLMESICLILLPCDLR